VRVGRNKKIADASRGAETPNKVNKKHDVTFHSHNQQALSQLNNHSKQSKCSQNARSPSSGKGSFEGKDCQEVYDVVIKQLKNTTARERYNESKHNFGRAATEKRDKEGLLHMKTFLEGVCPQILPASTI